MSRAAPWAGQAGVPCEGAGVEVAGQDHPHSQGGHAPGMAYVLPSAGEASLVWWAAAAVVVVLAVVAVAVAVAAAASVAVV